MYYKKFILDNGIQSMYVSKRDLNISCINITFKVGSKNESVEQLGISHFLEHMFFKGTQTYTTNHEITSQIESLGGYFNAYTTRDTTSFIIKINSKYIQKAIDILSNILLHSLFRKKDIEYEKNVVIEELMSTVDDPEYIVHQAFYSSIFKQVPLSKGPIGTVDTIQSLTRSSILNYMKKFYTSDNMNIIISSNLSFNRIENMLRRSEFNDFVSTDIKKNVPFEYIPNIMPTIRVKYKYITQEKIIIGFPICNAVHPDKYIINLISHLLTANMSSRLFIELREKNPLVYNIHSEAEYYQDMGIFYIKTEAKLDNVLDIDAEPTSSTGHFIRSLFGNSKPSKPSKRTRKKGVLSIILDTIRDLKNNILSKRELNDIVQSMVGSSLLNSEESTNIVNHYEHESVYNYNNIKSIRQLAKIYGKIRAKDILRVCNTYFLKNQMCITVLGKSNETSIRQFVDEYTDF